MAIYRGRQGPDLKSVESQFIAGAIRQVRRQQREGRKKVIKEQRGENAGVKTNKGWTFANPVPWTYASFQWDTGVKLNPNAPPLPHFQCSMMSLFTCSDGFKQQNRKF